MATGQNRNHDNHSKNKKNHSKSNINTTKRKVGRPKSANSKQLKKVQAEEDANKALFHDEIMMIVTLVISLLLILSNFDLSGNVGEFINGVTFGMIGFLAYLLPFCLFFGVAFYIANRGNRIAIRRLISAVSLAVVVTALIQLISTEYSNNTKIGDYYKISAGERNGGGIIGGTICKLLYPLFGTVGTYIILIALLIVFLMFITGKALFAYLGSKSEDSIKYMREQKMLREQEYLEEQNELGEGLQERRRARTVLLKKNKSGENPNGQADGLHQSSTSSMDNTNNSLNSNVHNRKKDKKAKGISVEGLPLVNLDYSFDMEEIKPIDMDSIPIQRGGSISGTTSEDKNKSYEEQLKMKFGKNIETTSNRPGIDDDIQKLLRAAQQDHENLTDNLSSSESDVNDAKKENVDSTGYVDSKGNVDTTGHLDSTGHVDSIGSVDNNGNNINLVQNSNDVRNENSDRKSNHEPNLKQIDKSISKNDLKNNNKTEADNGLLEINQNLEEKKEYIFPPLDLLTKPKANVKGMTDRELKETAVKLQKTLESFGVKVTITNVSCGPAVTRYELQPEQGVKVSKITGLADDIKLNLAAADIRIEAPIPGKAAVGIEVPNRENTMVTFREIIESSAYKNHPSDIAFAVGKDIGGQTVVTDIGKMPHLLIAGATGSGKSVCINTIIMSILYKAKPSDVRMIMIDPKVVELSVYNGIPHLLIPVVTDPKKASAALNWAVMEMTERYNKFAELGVRDIKGYNDKIATVEEYNDEKYQKLPQIIIIVDELADLMMVAPGEVEDAICRLAQMARASGLHLIIATQRPSVNVITGLIKANVPSRIAFSVSSAIDSRTILDGAGAEKLLGKGDMLFFPSGYPKPVRIQGAFVTDKEVSSVVEYLSTQNLTQGYSEDVANKITSVQSADMTGASSASDRDEYFIEAGKFIIDKDKASIGMLQRVYKIGFNRAARIMDQLSDAGVVGPEEGTKPRKVLMSIEEFEQYVDEYV